MFQKIELKQILIFASIIIVFFSIINIYQKLSISIPDDGILWKDTKKGFLIAQDISNPKLNPSISINDILISINGERVYDKIQFTKILWKHKRGEKLLYLIKRGNSILEILTTLGKKQIFFYSYLCIIGFSVLAFGLFVLIKGKNEKLAQAFYIMTLLLFSTYTFSLVGRLNKIDWFFYWVDEIALLALPLSFIYLCILLGGETINYADSMKKLKRISYIPIALITGKIFLFLFGIFGILKINANYELIYKISEKIDLAYLLAGVAFGVFILGKSYIISVDISYRNQVKLILAGIGAGFGPFVLVGIPYLIVGLPTKALELSTLSQIFIPIAFTYSLLKYRLMDVDIIIKRGIIYTITTSLIILLYIASMMFSLYIFGKGSTASLLISATLSTILSFIVFSPLRDRVKEIIDKKYYKDSYNYRETLTELTKTISSQTDILKLSKELIPMIAYTFQVIKIALYLRNKDVFELKGWAGLNDYSDSLSFEKNALDYLSRNNKIFLQETQGKRPLPMGLNYFKDKGFKYIFPCIYKDKVNGLIVLGSKANGELLTSEDEDLMIYISRNLSISIEISQLVLELSKKAEELERLKDFNENLLESINVGIVSFNLSKEIVWSNSCFSNIVKKKSKEIIGKKLEEVLPERFIKNVFDYFKSGFSQQFYKTFLRIGEAQLIVNVSLVNLKSNSEDSPVSILIIEDITSQSQMEEKLLHAQRLSSIGLLAAGVAHEVNTPLTGIASYAQILSKEIKDKKAQDILKKIQEQAFRASKTISNLLSLTKRQSLPLILVDLHEVISESIKLLKPHFKGRNIKIIKEFENKKYFIKGNEAKLQELIINLMLNAKDAMPEGGNITIKTWQENKEVYFSITDEGLGIDPSIQDKIFDPFFTTKPPGQGTGLGLSLCYTIVQEHGGNISFYSQKNKGTTFIINFPLASLKDEPERAYINS